MLGYHKGEGAQGGKDGHLQKILSSSPLVITKSSFKKYSEVLLQQEGCLHVNLIGCAIKLLLAHPRVCH